MAKEDVEISGVAKSMLLSYLSFLCILHTLQSAFADIKYSGSNGSMLGNPLWLCYVRCSFACPKHNAPVSSFVILYMLYIIVFIILHILCCYQQLLESSL